MKPTALKESIMAHRINDLVVAEVMANQRRARRQQSLKRKNLKRMHRVTRSPRLVQR